MTVIGRNIGKVFSSSLVHGSVCKEGCAWKLWLSSEVQVAGILDETERSCQAYFMLLLRCAMVKRKQDRFLHRQIVKGHNRHATSLVYLRGMGGESLKF